MREINWKKLVGAASAAVLAATQVAPAITAYAEEAGTTDYVYCAASLTWAEYWENEGVYLDSAADGNWEASSADADSHGETDLGAYDAVTRATSNHGLHRGSYQCTVKVFDTDGNSYDYTGKGQNESVDVASDRDAGTTTIMVDGKAAGAYDHSVIVGPKYVPVAVPAADYEDFKKAYTVYENGTEVKGGYTEKNLVNIDEEIQVDANTSGIKVAVANLDTDATHDDLTINAGSQIINQLKENDQLGWTFVSKDAAIEGVKSGEYYAAIIIPQDFSESLLSVLSGKKLRNLNTISMKNSMQLRQRSPVQVQARSRHK